MKVILFTLFSALIDTCINCYSTAMRMVKYSRQYTLYLAMALVINVVEQPRACQGILYKVPRRLMINCVDICMFRLNLVIVVFNDVLYRLLVCVYTISVTFTDETVRT